MRALLVLVVVAMTSSASANGRLPVSLITDHAAVPAQCKGLKGYRVGRVRLRDGATLVSTQSNVPLLFSPCMADLSVAIGPELIDELVSGALTIQVEACAADATTCGPLSNATPVVGPVALDTVLDQLYDLMMADVAVLHQRITDESDARMRAVGEAQARVVAEGEVRAAADQALHDRVTAEATARAQADAGVLGQLASEVTGRIAAIDGLRGELSGEADQRRLEDNRLRDAVLGVHAELGWFDLDGTAETLVAALAGYPEDAPDAAFDEGMLDCGTSGSVIFQSFTAHANGTLTSATIALRETKTKVTYRLRAGVGRSGPLMFERTIDPLVAGAPVMLDGVDVLKGHAYTIELAGIGGFAMRCNEDDGYPEGVGGTTASLPSRDYAFATTVAVDDSVVVTADGRIGVGTAAPTTRLDVDADSVRVRRPRSPASNDLCAVGEHAWDVDFVYVCVAPSTWRRAALDDY